MINPRRNTPRHIQIKLTKIQDRDKILKATREKWQIVQGNSHQVISWFLNRNFISQKGMAWYIWNDEREEPTIKDILPSKTFLQIWWRNQKLSRQAKVKRIQQHQTSFTTNAKGTFLGRKHKRRKRPTQNNPKQLRTWQ